MLQQAYLLPGWGKLGRSGWVKSRLRAGEGIIMGWYRLLPVADPMWTRRSRSSFAVELLGCFRAVFLSSNVLSPAPDGLRNYGVRCGVARSAPSTPDSSSAFERGHVLSRRSSKSPVALRRSSSSLCALRRRRFVIFPATLIVDRECRHFPFYSLVEADTL